MENIRIEVEEKKKYWQRMLGGLVFGFAIVTFTWAIIAVISHQLFPAGKSIIIFLYILSIGVQFINSDIQCACFITLLEIKDGYLYIEYMNRDKPSKVSGEIGNFSFVFGISGGRSAFIQTYHIDVKYANGRKIARQAYVWNWKKEPFIKLGEYLKRNHLLKTVWYQRYISLPTRDI